MNISTAFRFLSRCSHTIECAHTQRTTTPTPPPKKNPIKTKPQQKQSPKPKPSLRVQEGRTIFGYWTRYLLE